MVGRSLERKDSRKIDDSQKKLVADVRGSGRYARIGMNDFLKIRDNPLSPRLSAAYFFPRKSAPECGEHSS